MSMFELEPPVLILACPSCGATTNTSQSLCPSCSTPLDPAVAVEAAAAMSALNNACSDASFVGVILGVIITGALAGLWAIGRLHLPFAGALTVWLVAVAMALTGQAAMVLRWRLKFGSIRSADPEFLKSKREVQGAGGAVLFFFLLIGIAGFWAWHLASG